MLADNNKKSKISASILALAIYWSATTIQPCYQI